MTSTSDARTALEQLLTVAQQHGRARIVATCRLALQSLDDLEAALVLRQQVSRHGGQASWARLTPEAKRAQAQRLAACRWQKAADALRRTIANAARSRE